MPMLSAVPKYKACLEEFKDGFTKPAHESFVQLATAVISCKGSKTVRNMHKTLEKDERKSRTAYEYFFHNAKWDDVEVANRKAEVFFKAAKLGRKKKLFLTIDDTIEEKKGEATDGVGSFYDHTKQQFVWGNNFVTSTLQVGEIYVLHLARMYLKEEDAGENFRSKFDIAYEDMISTLRVRKGISVYVLFDSWWYSKDFIGKILALGYNVVGQLKSNSVVNGVNVSELAESVSSSRFKRVSIKVRGKVKSYYAHEEVVAIEGIGEVKLVVSKKSSEEQKFYFSTDVSLSAKEMLGAYENRWNIETAHQVANQELGFKDYQMRDKAAIERFMQLVFLVWAILVIAKLQNTGDIEAIVREMRISQLVDEARIVLLAKLFLKLYALLERKGVPSMKEAVEALKQLIE